MGEVVHTSRLRVERVKGPTRQAFLEGFDTPIRFGIHGGIKAFYGVEPEEDGYVAYCVQKLLSRKSGHGTRLLVEVDLLTKE